jgi:hypothetical protein
MPGEDAIHNRAWLNRDYFDLLRRHQVAAALVEHAWLPSIEELVAQQDVVTGPYAYVRLIGDRAGIEKVTQCWDRVVVDRTADLRRVAGPSGTMPVTNVMACRAYPPVNSATNGLMSPNDHWP